ncbi:MAG: RHS repeat-associated core domain-containing protein, partial [Candidatus Micrarchaeaceae archaeon]
NDPYVTTEPYYAGDSVVADVTPGATDADAPTLADEYLTGGAVGIDEVLAQYTPNDLDAFGHATIVEHPIQDVNQRVFMTLKSTVGQPTSIEERSLYSAFGEQTILSQQTQPGQYTNRWLPKGFTDPTTGAPLSQAPNAFSNPLSAAHATFGFQGRREEELPGVMNFRHRLYDPRLGRFLTPDPLQELKISQRQYILEDNQPSNYLDAQGLTPTTFTCNGATITLDLNSFTTAETKSLTKAWVAADAAVKSALDDIRLTINVFEKVYFTLIRSNKYTTYEEVRDSLLASKSSPFSKADSDKSEMVLHQLRAFFGYNALYVDDPTTGHETPFIAHDLGFCVSLDSLAKIPTRGKRGINNLRTIQSTLEKVYSALHSGKATNGKTIELYNYPKTISEKHAESKPLGNYIYLYWLFWKSVGRRPGILVHELTHVMANTNDWYYVQTTGRISTLGASNDTSPTYTSQNATVDTVPVSGASAHPIKPQTYDGVSTEKLLDNAANYEFYINYNYLEYTDDPESVDVAGGKVNIPNPKKKYPW